MQQGRLDEKLTEWLDEKGSGNKDDNKDKDDNTDGAARKKSKRCIEKIS